MSAMKLKYNELVVSLIARIRRKSHALIISELRRNGITGLKTSHGDILGCLFMKNTLSMNELATMIHKDKSTVTALVDKLVKLGYVEKTKSDIDSRVTYVTLTKKSKDLWPVISGISKKLISTIYQDFTDAERDELVRLLKRVDDNF
jgi:MarR family transcriptional regulator, organic hydroperoxide resistance regulator